MEDHSDSLIKPKEETTYINWQTFNNYYIFFKL